MKINQENLSDILMTGRGLVLLYSGQQYSKNKTYGNGSAVWKCARKPCLGVVTVQALNCRSDGGPKEAELKNVYKKCLKMQQDSKNSTKGNSEQDWKETRGQFDSNNWDKGRTGNTESRNNRNDRMNIRGKMNTRDEIIANNRDFMDSSNDRIGGNSNRASDGSDRMGSNRGKMGSSSDRMAYDKMRRRNDNGGSNREDSDRYGEDEHFDGRGDSSQRKEYGQAISQLSDYHTTRRYKREKRPKNSGQRSQYNPNIHKISAYEDNFRSDEKNSTENNSSKEIDNTACALHCFMENLEMTGEDGMPDRYLVTHAITKDVKNEDLRDFLQESIEECFQILDNENSEEKCEFSKNLLVCLSEKGRANCDDWKDDLKFQ